MVHHHHFAAHLAGLTPLHTLPTGGGTGGKGALLLGALRRTKKGSSSCEDSSPPPHTHASAPEQPQTRLLQNFWRTVKIKVSCKHVSFLLFTLRCRLPLLCGSSAASAHCRSKPSFSFCHFSVFAFRVLVEIKARAHTHILLLQPSAFFARICVLKTNSLGGAVGGDRSSCSRTTSSDR